MLTAQGLTVYRGTIPVVFDVNLHVPLNSVTILVGHNGAGKSSLMGALAGLYSATGTIRCCPIMA